MDSNDHNIFARALRFEALAQELFEPFDTSVKPRTYSAAATLEDLGGLNAVQADFLRQAVRSVEFSLFRGAIVIAFCAVSDLLAELAILRKDKVILSHPKWSYASKEELLEGHSDYQIFGALKKSGDITKTQLKTLQSLLHRRNQCAHPSTYTPGADEALGYVHECMQVVRQFS